MFESLKTPTAVKRMALAVGIGSGVVTGGLIFEMREDVLAVRERRAELLAEADLPAIEAARNVIARYEDTMKYDKRLVDEKDDFRVKGSLLAIVAATTHVAASVYRNARRREKDQS